MTSLYAFQSQAKKVVNTPTDFSVVGNGSIIVCAIILRLAFRKQKQ